MLLSPKFLAIVLLSLAVQETASQFCSLRGCCSGEDDSCSAPDGSGGVCYCDNFCLLTGDCCPDFASTCDDDECATDPSVCHGNATCHNTVGSYECVCKEGFVGNGAHCVDETLGPCETHTSINDPRRSSAFVPGPNDALICDNVLSAGWYRFGPDTGGKIPETCVQQFHCGTQVPIWLNGAHPTDYQAVNRDGCMNYGVPGDCCTFTVQIQVQRCPSSYGNPDFFIYNLQPPTSCDIGYCADPTPVNNATTARPTRPPRTMGSSRSEPRVTRTATTRSTTVSQGTAMTADRATNSQGTAVTAGSAAKSTTKKSEEDSRTTEDSTTPMNERTGGPQKQQPAAPTSKRTVTADATGRPGTASENGIIIGATSAGLIFALVTSIIIYVLCRKRKPLSASGDGFALGNLRKADGSLYDVKVDTKGSPDPPHEYATMSSFSSQLPGTVNIGGGLSKLGASPPTDDHTYQSLGPTDPQDSHEYQSLTPRTHDYENVGFMSE